MMYSTTEVSVQTSERESFSIIYTLQIINHAFCTAKRLTEFPASSFWRLATQYLIAFALAPQLRGQRISFVVSL